MKEFGGVQDHFFLSPPSAPPTSLTQHHQLSSSEVPYLTSAICSRCCTITIPPLAPRLLAYTLPSTEPTFVRLQLPFSFTRRPPCTALKYPQSHTHSALSVSAKSSLIQSSTPHGFRFLPSAWPCQGL